MKKLIGKATLKTLLFLTLIIAFGSCTDDLGTIEAPLNEGVFEESPIISFDEIEKMTEETITGELDTAEVNATTSLEKTENAEKKAGGISIERRRYDFTGEAMDGADKGAMIEGDLKLNFTLFHSLFAIFRGNLVFADGSTAPARGAWISDGYVYLIIKTADGYIRGYGMADEEGNLKGRFRLTSSNGKSVGDWAANLTSVTTPGQTIVDIVVNDDRFTTLVKVLSEADLVETLNGDGPFTVFAPVNDAFDALETVPEGEILKQILLYHVTSGKIRSQELLKKEMVASLQGEDIKITLNSDNEIVINDMVKVIQSNIRAKNGMIHVIESVLIPPSYSDLPSIVDIATGDDNFSLLVGALTAADLVETLQGDGPFTVFAPTNDAFLALDAIPDGDALKEVLLYHVVSGRYLGADLLKKDIVTTAQGEEVTIEWMEDKVVLNGMVTVTTSDVLASNGVVHVIDGVLIPPSLQLKSIVEIAAGNPDFSTLVSALTAAELVETLQGDGPFTVFAPTNDAFTTLDAIPEGDALKQVLLYHVLSGKYTSDDLFEKTTVTTVQGEEVTIEFDDDTVVLNGTVRVTVADIMASNGVIHVIDNVLIPPSMAVPSIVEIATGSPDFSTLVGALDAAGLVETLQGEGPFTVFAPTNHAFAALDAIPEGDALKEVLLYHVASGKYTGADLLEKQTVTTVQGEMVTIELVHGNVVLNGSVTVTTADIMASNGIVHVIDGVLIPPSMQLPSIVDIATGSPDFSTLVGALDAAGLVETLQGEGPFTVFAPTNHAFAALDAIPEGDALKEVLLYHVASGKYTGADLLEKQTVTTVQGEMVTIELVHGNVVLNGSVTVTTADIMASNGIVHVIDGVLIPPSMQPKTIVEIAVGDPNFSTLVSALKDADLVDTLQGDGPFTVFAPTNAAFEALHEMPEGDALIEVLLYHVIAGKYTGAELVEKHTVKTQQGADITIQMKDGKVILNDAVTVTVANIEASNGIIHVINHVLIPPTH